MRLSWIINDICGRALDLVGIDLPFTNICAKNNFTFSSQITSIFDILTSEYCSCDSCSNFEVTKVTKVIIATKFEHSTDTHIHTDGRKYASITTFTFFALTDLDRTSPFTSVRCNLPITYELSTTFQFCVN